MLELVSSKPVWKATTVRFVYQSVCIAVLNAARIRSDVFFFKPLFPHKISALKIVGVFRSDESAEKTKAVLGDPPEERLVTVIGSLGMQANTRCWYSDSSVYSRIFKLGGNISFFGEQMY